MKETETQKAIEAILKKHICWPLYEKEKTSILAAMEEYAIAGRSKALEEKEKEIDNLTISITNHALEIEKIKSRERELEEALRDLYNAIDSLPNWKKRDTLAQHCDMEKAKQLLNNH